MNAHGNIVPTPVADSAVVANPILAPGSRGVPAFFPDVVGNVVQRGGLAPWQQKKVLMYIEQNFTSTIRIEALADLARLSVSHFARAFRLTFNRPPYGYILERRMILAKDLMAGTDCTLSQIALDCGMSDQAHFCKVFRKTFGTSPNRWRQPNRAAVATSRSTSFH